MELLSSFDRRDSDRMGKRVAWRRIVEDQPSAAVVAVVDWQTVPG